ncbi:MAG: hypothetical protein IT337_02720 [Thermomicrobiales bacterium]|nr:hypothetical protein [Thermomicrobiales bacterium]
MDRLSSLMVRASLVWLLLGVVIGGLMLNDALLPGQWVAWFVPTHAHMLFVGWFLQFVLAIAFWLLPRKRSEAAPQGYNERVAAVAAAALNLGLLLRVAAEPATRAGSGGGWTTVFLAASALLQVGAAVYFAGSLWPRTAARAPRKTG